MAQGITGGSVQGIVTSATGAPVEDATVRVTNLATGERWQALTRSGGRYTLEHLAVGGPYGLDVRALGFAPAERAGLSISQGQRLWQEFRLTPSAVTLDEITVRARTDPELNAGRTGPSLTLTDSAIARLPLDIRDFSRLAVLSPLVTPGADGGLSFAGEHSLLNSILVDGTIAGSLRGGGPDGFGGIPGNQNEFGYFDIVPEAVQEIQVMTAPYDVRYGNFAGGLISAVTKSGTNRWHGSLYGYLNSPSLAGHNPDHTRLDPFTRQELGVTLGGPIVRDRLAFFLQAGGNRNRYPHTTRSPGPETVGVDSAIGIGYASAVRFRQILADSFGVDAGSFAGIDRRVSIGRVFAKITAQLGVNNRLELSQSYLHESPRLADEHGPGFIGLSSAGAYDPNAKADTRLEWTAAFAGRWTNQATLAYRRDQHRCFPNATFVMVEVAADSGVLHAGQQRGCIGNDNLETVWEATDNLELGAGAHHFTFGSHNELVRITDAGAGDNGQWFFDSLDSLEQGLPSAYERFAYGPDAPSDTTTRVRVTQLGLYVQDQWTPNSRLTVTAGMRGDVPLLTDKPVENRELLDALGISSATTPSGKILWSPRVGVNYDMSGRGTAFIRGGIGLFSGPPAYVWLENAYADVGRVAVTVLQCAGNQVPALTLDPASQPAQCANADPPRPSLTVFDPRFRYPRDLKLTLGADVALPWGLLATADLLFTAGVNQFAERDLNLGSPVGAAAGEGGRPLYGTIDSATGLSTPNHRNSAFDAVTQITNGSGNRSYAAALQLRKRFGTGGDILAAYTYTAAKNRTDLPGLSGRGNLGFSVLDGTWEEPSLRTALWSRPHKVTLVATTDLPLGLQLGVTYIGISGTPLTYTVNGDANGDGFDDLGNGRYNDAVYVPRDAGDITLADGQDFAALDRFIESEPCLRERRGALLQRNSCRNPWSNRIDARLSEAVPGLGGRSLELVADVFNLPNLLDHDWGQVRQTVDDFGSTSRGNRIALLELVGYDEARGRGVYNVLAPRRHEVDVDATRWRVRLSVRYGF